MPTLGDLIPQDVRAKYPDEALTPKALKVLSLPQPALTADQRARLTDALTASLPRYTLQSTFARRGFSYAPGEARREAVARARTAPTLGAPGSNVEAPAERSAPTPLQGMGPVGSFVQGAGEAAIQGLVGLPQQAVEFYRNVTEAPMAGTLGHGPEERPEGVKEAARTIAEFSPVDLPGVGHVFPAMALGGVQQGLAAGEPVETPEGPRAPTAGEVAGRLGGAAVGLGMGLPGVVGKALPKLTPEAARAAQANIAPPPGMADHLRPVAEQASKDLASAIAEMQAKGPVPFRGGGLDIPEAYIEPSLVRVFPGAEVPVRATVVDQSTGDVHSVALPSIGALREAVSPQVEQPSTKVAEPGQPAEVAEKRDTGPKAPPPKMQAGPGNPPAGAAAPSGAKAPPTKATAGVAEPVSALGNVERVKPGAPTAPAPPPSESIAKPVEPKPKRQLKAGAGQPEAAERPAPAPPTTGPTPPPEKSAKPKAARGPIKFENLGSVGPGTLYAAQRGEVRVSMVHNGVGAPEAELTSMLKAAEKKARAEAAVTHESRMAEPGEMRRVRRAPPEASSGRGLREARTVQRVPTAEESRTLPQAPVPEAPPDARRALPAETVAKASDVWRKVIDAVNPVKHAVGPGLDKLMEYKGSLDHALFRLDHPITEVGKAQKATSKWWDGQPMSVKLDFWNRLEHGRQADPRLASLDAAYRERANNVFAAYRRYREIPYWENYFPHLWKDQKAAAQFMAARRPMGGTRRAFKARELGDINAGLKAGLKLAIDNPEKMIQAMEHDARKFVHFQELQQDLKQMGLQKFKRLGAKMPEGMASVDQNWAKVFLNPEIPIEEHFDARVMEGLQATARRLGIAHERKVKTGLRRALGYSESQPGRVGRVVTKFATPESVLAHEIGHQIDSKYGLQEQFIRESTPRVRKELKALADLRFEGVDPDASFKSYVRSRPEKMAVMLEALIHAPEKFKEVAPFTYRKFTTFLASKPELKGILDIKPSLLTGKGKATVSAGGAVLGGEWVFEENLARLLDNYMSRDPIGGQGIVGTGVRGAMATRNFINSMELGVSGFHALGITLLSAMNQTGTAISELAHGRPAQAAGKFLRPPVPIDYVREGWKFYRGDPELAYLEKMLFTAGAKLRSSDYQNGAFDGFIKNTRQALANGTPYERLGSAGKAAAQAPFAAIEASMRVLSDLVIPQMKIGAFREIYASQLKLKAQAIADGLETKENVARIAWRDVEDRFGLINYDNEFWNNTLKRTLMVLIRAPGWTMGTMRSLGGGAFVDMPRFAARGARRMAGDATGPAPEWTQRMSFALSMPFVTMAIGGLYTYGHTGKPPENLEDLLHPRNGLTNENGTPQRVNLPTFMRDVSGWSADPIKTAVGRRNIGKGQSSIGHGGKLASEWSLILDLLENQSHRGPIRNVNAPLWDQAGQVARYLFGRVTPFSIHQARQIRKEGGSAEQVGEQFFGVTPYYPPKEGTRERFRYREVEQ